MWALGFVGVLLGANVFVIWAEMNDDTVDSFMRGFGVNTNNNTKPPALPEEELELSRYMTASLAATTHTSRLHTATASRFATTTSKAPTTN